MYMDLPSTCVIFVRSILLSCDLSRWYIYHAKCTRGAPKSIQRQFQDDPHHTQMQDTTPSCFSFCFITRRRYLSTSKARIIMHVFASVLFIFSRYSKSSVEKQPMPAVQPTSFPQTCIKSSVNWEGFFVQPWLHCTFISVESDSEMITIW